MKCIIIANGDLEYSSQIRKMIDNAPLIVSADGGARHLKAFNVIPHVLIGDFDSIRPEDKKYFAAHSINTIDFPSKKDVTDTELCIKWALAHHATDITLLGVTGTRLDHTLANIFLLKRLAMLNIPARIIDKYNEIHIVTDSLTLEGEPGSFLSIIPVSKKVIGITLTGLTYPLKDATIHMGSSQGISNVFAQNRASISLKRGILIVTKSKD